MDQEFINRIEKGIEYERNRQGPPDNFPALPPIPGGRYTDPDFFALEQECLWKRSWLYACHSDELPAEGSYKLLSPSGSPVVIVRGKDGNIRAFYNTCRHRGGPLVKERSGQVNGGFVCGYHGWSYDLEGRLRGLRDRKDFVDLDMDCYGLIGVRCERLGNWIFFNEDQEAEPLLQSLGPIAEQLSVYDPGSIRHVHSDGFEVACNVKVLLEAFLEIYHLQAVHKNTVHRFLDYRASHITLWPGGNSLMVTSNRDPDWQDPGARGLPRIATVPDFAVRNNVSYNLFPNVITPVTDTGMPFLVFWPKTHNTMYIECHWFAPGWGDGALDPLWHTRIKNFERILAEDTDFAPQIQNSLESPGFKAIKLNYQERRIYHWHEELDRRIGVDRIPEHLRVQPRLGAFIDDMTAG